MLPTEPFEAPRRQGLRALILAHAVTVLSFYGVLFALARNLPFEDDYDSGLNFANHLAQLPTFSQRAAFYLTSQHNEYKLFLGHAVVWLQLALLGHLNFTALSTLGNLSILGLGFVLWKMFLPDEADLRRRLALFLPVTLLLFEFQYWETLNWPLPGLQNLPVVAFVMGSIYLLNRPGPRALAGAIALFALAIAASASGFMVFPVGLVLLLWQRRPAALAAWLAAFAASLAIYAYHYSVVTNQGGTHLSLFDAIRHPRILYVLAFLGSAAAWPFPALALPAGLALCLFFAWLAWRGYPRRDPAIACAVLFLLLTAVGVAGLRADLALALGIPSRYRIYSDLLLILAWFAIVRESLAIRTQPLRRNRFFIAVLAAVVVYSAAMDAVGIHNRLRRDRITVEGMADFEHPATPGSALGPVLPPPTAARTAAAEQFNAHARAVLLESERLHVYTPPAY